VLIAQDLASWGHDRRRAGRGEAVEVLDEGGTQPLIELTKALVARSNECDSCTSIHRGLRAVSSRPSSNRRALLRPLAPTRVASAAARDATLGRRRSVLERIEAIRRSEPDATFRSSFILGYPGETEDDQRALLEFIDAAQLDWPDSSPFRARRAPWPTVSSTSPPRTRPRASSRGQRAPDAITARRRDALVEPGNDC